MKRLKYKIARGIIFTLNSPGIWKRSGLMLALILTVTSCSPASEDKMVPLLPNGMANLVIIYKKETTNNQITYFLDNVLAHPRADGKGSELPKSIRLQASERIIGYDATIIAYRTEATPEQREEVKRAALSSPIVYKVLEDVVPSQIKQIE